jgi:hypothetical protein
MYDFLKCHKIGETIGEKIGDFFKKVLLHFAKLGSLALVFKENAIFSPKIDYNIDNKNCPQVRTP